MAQSFWKRGLAVMTAAGALGFLLAGCGAGGGNNTTTAQSPTDQKPVEGGNILLDSTSNFKDLDPALAYDTTSGEAVSQMYDQLVTYKKDTTDIIRMLGDYTVSSDGLTYTFKIKQGVTFWNGDPLTSKSFADEFKRVLDPKVASPGEGFLDPIVVGSTDFNKGRTKDIAGITTPDDNTLVIKLTKPEPFFLQVLAMPFFSAVDQKYIDKVGNKAFDSNTAMGSGPFKFQTFDANQLVLVKNDKYWRKDDSGNQLPYLDKITMRINKNGQLDALNFEQGKTALIGQLFGSSGIPSSSYPHFSSAPNLKSTIRTLAQNATFYVGLNNKIAPFDNVKVRQAVEYAIDKKKIVQLLNGRGQVADQPLPPGIDAYVKDLSADGKYDYNPTKAKQLLSDAGVQPGTKITFYSSNDPDTVKIVESIQNDLNNIGFNCQLQTMDWNSFLSLNEKGKTGIFQLAWIQDFPDASDFLNTLFNTNQQPANNSTLYSNAQVDQWLNQAQTDTNQQERLDLYKKASEQIMKDADWVPLYYPQSTFAVQPWVHNFYMSPVMMDPLEYIWIDQSHSQN